MIFRVLSIFFIFLGLPSAVSACRMDTDFLNKQVTKICSVYISGSSSQAVFSGEIEADVKAISGRLEGKGTLAGTASKVDFENLSKRIYEDQFTSIQACQEKHFSEILKMHNQCLVTCQNDRNSDRCFGANGGTGWVLLGRYTLSGWSVDNFEIAAAMTRPKHMAGSELAAKRVVQVYPDYKSSRKEKNKYGEIQKGERITVFEVKSLLGTKKQWARIKYSN